MSFSTQVKEELNSIKIKGNCCKRAYLFGAVLSAETDDKSIQLKLADPQTAEKIASLLKTIFNCTPDTSTQKRGCCETTTLKFESKKLLDFIKFADSFCDGQTDSLFTCQNCKSAFLRGVFCASGSISDPVKSYTLEIRAKNENRAKLIQAVIALWDIEIPKQTKRGDSMGLFYRRENMIEYFLSACGAAQAVFALNNIWAEKDIRNDENRKTNCDSRNIARLVNAASEQISAIELLIAYKYFDELPNDLKITAKLRLEHQDIGLSELAQLHIPPISRSGLDHRLTRIIDEAKKRKLM